MQVSVHARFAAAALAVAVTAAGCGGETSRPAAPAAPALAWVPDASRGTIATVVGTGKYGFQGIGGPAKDVGLWQPIGVAFDGAGNLYIAERFNHRILKVDRSGTVTVAAGIVDEDGEAQNGFSGDGGPATDAKLFNAHAILPTRDGTLYIADSGNHRIRMVDPDGIITTVAGNGEQGFSGDGGAATEASLDNPLGLALDEEGNLYFLDAGNHRIRMVDRQETISTVAGSGELGSFSEPWFSPDGTPASEVRIGDPTDHMPMGLLFGADGNLVFTDMGTRRIRMIDADGRVRTIAGNGRAEPALDGQTAAEAPIHDPMDIALGGDGTVYVTTHSHGPAEGNLVLAVDADGTLRKVAGVGAAGYSGDGGSAEVAQLNVPSGLTIGPDGNLYFADALNNVIRMVVLR